MPKSTDGCTRNSIFTQQRRSVTIFTRSPSFHHDHHNCWPCTPVPTVALCVAAGLAIAQDDDPHAICGPRPLRHCACYFRSAASNSLNNPSQRFAAWPAFYIIHLARRLRQCNIARPYQVVVNRPARPLTRGARRVPLERSHPSAH